MLSIVMAVSGGIFKGVPAFPFVQRGDHVFTKATRSARCCGVKAIHAGIFVVTNPRVTALYRSSSVGKVPVGVERHLKVASVKSLGLGSIHSAFMPSPLPSGPWQPIQYLR